MMTIKNITMADPLYDPMRELRNKVLLRPLGIPDNSWEMHDEKSWHFVAVEDNMVMGCAVLVPSEETPGTAQLMQMAVDTNIQGKGIGKLLLCEIITFARNKGLQEISCHSRKYAVDFYTKLGFKVYGKPFEEVGIPHNHMKLKLHTTNK
ncbi:GNAT family N-acetyltransferase [Sinomicrobium sp. M5D2P17]